jgi:hypothetical protein
MIASEQQTYLLDLATKDPHIMLLDLQVAVNTYPSNSTVRRQFRSLHMLGWTQRSTRDQRKEGQ